MGKSITFFIICALFLTLNFVSASSYQASYTQLGENIIFKENVNGLLSPLITFSNYIEKSGSSYYLVKKIIFPDSFDEAKIILNLDYGFIVEDQKAYPSGYKIESDGETISLIWDFEEVKAGQEVAIFVTLKDTKQDWSFVYGVIGGFIILISGLIFYKNFFKNKRITKRRKKKSIKINKTKKEYDYLLDTEKRVIEELKKADRNEMWQKQIQNSTGYSKAKVSRLVRNLEARGLIVKIPFGNTNKVRLK